MRKLMLIATMSLLIKGSAADSGMPVVPPPIDAAPHAPATLTVMTYNVAAMPWPAAQGRGPALDAIAARLRALRAADAAPHVIVLQEAFTDQARALGAAAGYRYVVEGPAADAARPAPPRQLAAAFLDARSLFTGEGFGPLLSSGLVILSDYPILGSARIAFPRDACAGYDCLANKGALIARIAVPGAADPVEIVTTHLNAGRKSGTPIAHHLYAYRQQMAALDRFLATNATPGAARIVAGDFNVSHSAERLGRFRTMWRRAALTPVTAMGREKPGQRCGIDGACAGTLPIAPNVPVIHATDWQFFTSGRATELKPLSRTVAFGREADGGMLSDHFGYAITYAIGTRS